MLSTYKQLQTYFYYSDVFLKPTYKKSQILGPWVASAKTTLTIWHVFGIRFGSHARHAGAKEREDRAKWGLFSGWDGTGWWLPKFSLAAVTGWGEHPRQLIIQSSSYIFQTEPKCFSTFHWNPRGLTILIQQSKMVYWKQRDLVRSFQLWMCNDG